MTKYLLLILCLVGNLFSQNASTSSNQTRLYYDGSGNLQYICLAKSIQPTLTVLSVVSATAGTPISLITSGNHGLLVGSTVTISGTPGISGMIGTFTVTPDNSDPTKLTLNSSVGTGSFNSISPTLLKTVSPRGPATVWSIQQLLYDTSHNIISSLFANGSSQSTFSCDARATYGYQ